MRGGIGTASVRVGAVTVGAIVACNALGDVADRSFEKLDADKDGTVTKEEFEKADGFGDLGGKIDTEKLKKLLQKKKGDPRE